MKKAFRLLAVFLAFALAVSLSACGGKSGSAEGGAANSNTFVVGLTMEAESLDPAFAYDYITLPVVGVIYESLLMIDENGTLAPRLASAWEAVDQTTYVYQIRDDVLFSDGTPMTMEDVLYSLERIRGDEVGSYLTWMYDGVESIEQTGDWELTIKLSKPDALWQYVLSTSAGQIVKKEVVEAQGSLYGNVGGQVVGTGPYMLANWEAGGDITVTYNENYWDAAETPDFTSIIFRPIPEESTRAMAIKTGQIDVDFAANHELLDEIESSGKASRLISPKWATDFIAFNCQLAPFDDVNARRAVASAIDIATLQTSVIKNFGLPTNGMIVPDSLFLFEKERWEQLKTEIPIYDYDLEKAKEYLAKSSYPNGFSFTLFIDQYEINNSIAVALQQELKEIGIDMQIEKTTNEENISLEQGSGIVDGIRPYQAIIGGWISDFPDPAGMLNILLLFENAGETGCNSAAYNNPAVEVLLKKQLESIDAAERTELMCEALVTICDEVPYYALYQSNNVFVVSNRIANPEVAVNAAYIWYFPVHKLKLA